MSDAQNSGAGGSGEPGDADAGPYDGHAPGAPEGGAAGAEYGTEDGAGFGGHTLLCRPAVPQGRRTLFRS